MTSTSEYKPFDSAAATSQGIPLGDVGWSGFFRQALLYQPDKDLCEALWAAWSLQRPLLLRGLPGSGKSTAAYWAALKLAAHFNEPPTQDLVQHVQIRSNSSAQELKYGFDHLARLRDANRSTERGIADYVRPGPLWFAFDQYSLRSRYVVLLDELDKAPRDLPNDLLYELDKFEFEVPELAGSNKVPRVGVDRVTIPGFASSEKSWDAKKSLFILTSNDERVLPPAFLRRCIHYEIRLGEDRINSILRSRFTSLTALVDLLRKLRQFLSSKVPSPMPLERCTDWLRLREIAGETAADKSASDKLGRWLEGSNGQSELGELVPLVLDLPQVRMLLTEDALDFLSRG